MDTDAATTSSASEGSGSTSEVTASSDPTTASSTTSDVTTTDPTTGTEGGEESSSTGGPPAPTFEEHYMGRFDRSEGAPRSTWSGSTARTRIDGTEVSIALDGPSGIHFQTVVDGVATGEFVTGGGPQSYVVASGLEAGEHPLLVVADGGGEGVAEALAEPRVGAAGAVGEGEPRRAGGVARRVGEGAELDVERPGAGDGEGEAEAQLGGGALEDDPRQDLGAEAVRRDELEQGGAEIHGRGV